MPQKVLVPAAVELVPTPPPKADEFPKVYYGSDVDEKHPLTKAKIEDLLRRYEKETGVSFRDAAVGIRRAIPWEVVKRYYVPKSWHPKDIGDRLRTWILSFGIPWTWLDRGDFYSPMTRTVHLEYPNIGVAAHELGHYADMEMQRGPYGSDFSRRALPTHDVLSAEIAATLLARKVLSEKDWREAEKVLAPALTTYLAWRTMPAIGPLAALGTRLGVYTPPDPNWKENLVKAWRSGDAYAREAALWGAMRYFYQKYKGRPMVQIDPFKGEIRWANRRDKALPSMLRLLLDEEFRRVYGDLPTKSKKAPSAEERGHTKTALSLEDHRRFLIYRRDVLQQMLEPFGFTSPNAPRWADIIANIINLQAPARIFSADRRGKARRWVAAGLLSAAPVLTGTILAVNQLAKDSGGSLGAYLRAIPHGLWDYRLALLPLLAYSAMRTRLKPLPSRPPTAPSPSSSQTAVGEAATDMRDAMRPDALVVALSDEKQPDRRTEARRSTSRV